MNKKMIAMILAVIAIGVVIYWAAAGASLYTVNQEKVAVKDELFGTTSYVWKDTYKPGLEVIGPVAGVLLVAAAWLTWSGRKRQASLS